MNKRLFLLNGLGILGVLVSHAAGWGQIAMTDWAGQYLPMSGVNYYLTYVFDLVVRQAAAFCVVAFLFVSGFFIAYADRGKKATFGWKMVWVRIRNLLIPYTIWSVLILLSQYFIDHHVTSFKDAIISFFTTGVDGPYYFVPLLCYLYLLSPLMIPLAKKRPRLFLYVCALIQLTPMAITYFGVFKEYFPGLRFLYHTYIPDWLFVKWIFFFALGLTCGFHMEDFKVWLQKARVWLLVGVSVTAILAIIEPEVVYRATGIEWRFVPLMLSTALYSVFFVLFFLAFDIDNRVISKYLVQWGGKSFGIYLLHMQSMEFVARMIYHFTPFILGNPLIFQPIIFIAGLGLPLMFIWLISYSPARATYRYLFG